MKITPISESAIVCTLPPPASLENQRKLWAFAEKLNSQATVLEVVVGMNNLTVFVDFCLDFNPLIEQLRHFWQTVKVEEFESRYIEIPVVYGGKIGEDLQEVAAFHHTTAEKIIEMHTAPLYTVYMIGFQAGFPYLGGLLDALHTPRKSTPRTLVPAGAVGIGGAQTGIYPFASPGGWQLIGHTKTPLFDKNKAQPTLLQAGDQVKFVVENIEL